MVVGMKLNLPVQNRSTSRGRARDNSGPRNKAFPQTPRSIEKQRKILAAKLKKAMEDNLRVKAHNRILKDTNQKYLDAFASKDQEYQRQKALNVNARRELNFKVLVFHKIQENLAKLDQRERFQHKNLRGLVKFAKKLTVELEEHKQKVIMSEQIVKDLKQAGTEDMGSLIGMMKQFRENELNTRDEIDKLGKLTLLKDNEVAELDVEIRSLNDFLDKMRDTQFEKILMFKKEIEKNQKIIRRQDKLIVDLQQRNELSQNVVTVTQEQIAQKDRVRTKMEVKMKELSDQRDYFTSKIISTSQQLNSIKQIEGFGAVRSSNLGSNATSGTVPKRIAVSNADKQSMASNKSYGRRN